MDGDKNEERGFRVVDKRRFDSEGDTKPGQCGAEIKDTASAAQPLKKPAAREPEPREAAKKTADPGKSAPDGANAEGVDFSSFVVSLATQALIMLGEVPNPESQQVVYYPDAAKETIDIIGMLREKTKGNVSKEEAKLLDDVLASLRMAYVKKAGLK